MKIAAFGSAMALSFATLLAACSGTPTRYYTLADTTGAATATTALANPIYFELSPIAMPERLARPQLVVRRPNAPASQVEILEQSRWSSSFESEMRDALGAGIASRVPAVDVTKSGRSRGQPVYRVSVQLAQFDALEGSRLDSAFSWTLRRTDDDPLVSCQLSLSEPLAAGLDGVAQGAQRVTARAAEAIAGSIASMAAKQGPSCPA